MSRSQSGVRVLTGLVGTRTGSGHHIMPPGKWVGHAHCYKNLIIARRRRRRRPVRCVSCETGLAARHEYETLNAREMDRSVCTLGKRTVLDPRVLYPVV